MNRPSIGRAHLSIGEVLSLLQDEFPDVTISKIRFLESQGLLDPERTPSGYRKFYEYDIERLRWILRLQKDHYLPLKVIKDRLDEAGGIPPADMAEMGLGADGADAAAEATEAAGAKDGKGKAAESNGAATLFSSADGAGSGSGRVAVTERAVRVAPSPSSPSSPPPSSGGSGSGSRSASAPAPAPSARSDAAATEPRARPPAARARNAAPASPRAASPAPAPAPAARQPGGRAPVRRAPQPSANAPRAGASTRARQGQRPGDRNAAPSSPRAEPPPRADGTGPDNRPLAGVGFDAGADAVNLTLEELAEASGLTVRDIRDLERFGLIEARDSEGPSHYDGDALIISRTAAGFLQHGIEARHMRSYKVAVDREAGLFEQIVSPLLKQRNPEARTRATRTVTELIRLGEVMRGVLLRRELRDHIGGP